MRDGVRFLLGNETRELESVDPTLTVLRYLREVERRMGTKEGCAEGDCGACTVVIGEPGPDGMRYKAVNSCIQFVPTLDGKQLLTVEDLAQADGTLHPVQDALCDTHASQCGFCTPGFVMSLYAQSINGEKPARSELKDILAGNLCRCTGYGPILDAGDRMGDRPAPVPADASDTLNAWAGEAVTISGKGRRFHAPASGDELAELYEQYPDALIISGLTDVGLWVTKQHRDLVHLISLGKASDLTTIDVADGHVSIGAGVTIADAHAVLGEHFGDLGELIRRFASLQIRNAATVCGNIANGSPIGDLPPALIALGAELTLRRGSVRRTLPLEDYFIEYGRQDRQVGEFVEAVRVPLLPEGRRFRCYKLTKRFDQDISAVCAAFAFSLKDGTARDVRICYGGMAGTPKRAGAAEAVLEGAEWTEEIIRAAMVALESDYTPMTDMRGSADYRMVSAQNLLLKTYLETTDRKDETRVLETQGGGT